MLSLRSSAALDDMSEPMRPHGTVMYAATLILAALLAVVRLVRFYTAKRATPLLESSALDCEADGWTEESEPAWQDAEPDSEEPVPEVPELLLHGERLAVYDFDETLTRATYPQQYDGTPFGCMSLSIGWDDARAGKRRDGDTSPCKEFGGFDAERVAQLQGHLAAMRAQGWTCAVLSYNLQWDKREFCLLDLLEHYGMLQYFTSHGRPLVFGLRDMRRVGAASKGDFICKALQNPQRVLGVQMDLAPRWGHVLVDDDDVNISTARGLGLLGYLVPKRYEWDGIVGGLGRADPLDFDRLESLGKVVPAHVLAEKGKRRRRGGRRNEGRRVKK